MIREVSAGGVVVRRMHGRWWIAAIEPQGRSQSKPVWALPKGLLDEGESSAQAARREILEETGVQAELIVKLEDIKYVYVRSWSDNARIFKIVSFFLFRYESGELGEISEDMQKEVRRAEWIPLEEAPKRLSYRGEREVATKAQAYLEAHPELSGVRSQ